MATSVVLATTEPPASPSASTSTPTPTATSTTAKQTTSSFHHANGKPSKPEKMAPKYRHVFATHSQQQISPFTHGATAPSFVGFRNLMILVLIFSNLRLMIENFQKYGVVICVHCHDYRRQDVTLGLLLYLSVPCHLFIAYLIELAAVRQAKSAMARMKRAGDEDDTPEKQAAARRSFHTTWWIIAVAHGINASASLMIASTVVYFDIHHPGIGTLCELHAIVLWLKVCSYAFTNRDLRHAHLHPNSSAPLPAIYSECAYPRNINFKNLCYFWWAPTLIYQPVYPRTSHIRWTFVFKRLLEVAGLSIVIWIASAQYAAPLLQNSMDKMLQLDIVSILERVMKLSTISLFCWLCGFYALFQSALNALAEIMTFGDRDFYSDWWNVSSIRQYWTSWNKPVTNFMRRHVYSPLVGRGWSPQTAQLAVFVLSGVLHELAVGIPTHNVIGVAFAGMMIQIPLILLTDKLQRLKGMTGKVAGNVIFWISFCLVGQPLAALLYFFAWQAKYGSVAQNRATWEASPVGNLLGRR